MEVHKGKPPKVWLVFLLLIKISVANNYSKGKNCVNYASELREFTELPLFIGIQPLQEEWQYMLEFNHKSDFRMNFMLNVTNGRVFQDQLLMGQHNDKNTTLNWTKDNFHVGNWSYMFLYEENGELVISDLKNPHSSKFGHLLEDVTNQKHQILIKTNGSKFQVNCEEGCQITPMRGEFTAEPQTTYKLKAVNPLVNVCIGSNECFPVGNLKWYAYSPSSEMLSQPVKMELNGSLLIKTCNPKSTEASPTFSNLSTPGHSRKQIITETLDSDITTGIPTSSDEENHLSHTTTTQALQTAETNEPTVFSDLPLATETVGINHTEAEVQFSSTSATSLPGLSTNKPTPFSDLPLATETVGIKHTEAKVQFPSISATSLPGVSTTVKGPYRKATSLTTWETTPGKARRTGSAEQDDTSSKSTVVWIVIFVLLGVGLIVFAVYKRVSHRQAVSTVEISSGEAPADEEPVRTVDLQPLRISSVLQDGTEM